MHTSAITSRISTVLMAMEVAMEAQKVVANLMESPIRALVVEMVVATSDAEMNMKKTALTGRSDLQTAMAETTVADYDVGKYTKVLVSTLCTPLVLSRISHFPIEVQF